ncbi:hypothetical protein [Streptomyces sp. NPDC093591]|uniref:MmyB family transcriptional regulator n=1 Tax=Streptomyces sp. NPDC093591 TaxID=3366044 RepID=UPI0037F51666
MTLHQTPGQHVGRQLGPHTPALVLGRRLDVLASNRMARALLTDFDALPHRERNLMRFMFCDETASSLATHWDTHAQDIVASLRRDAGRHPHDPLPAELVGELSIADEDFRRWWADQNVYTTRDLARAARRSLDMEHRMRPARSCRAATPDT